MPEAEGVWRAEDAALALVTELFRDWESPLADKAREVIKGHQPEIQKLLAAR